MESQYVKVPGDRVYELPPLLVHANHGVEDVDGVIRTAQEIVDAEGLVVTEETFDQRRFDLAVKLTDLYLALVTRWRWGHGIFEWIRQCETTFRSRDELRGLIRGDVWPRADHHSFVKLLEDKPETRENFQGIDVGGAVGVRLIFNELPPIGFFSGQFLFYLNLKLGNTAYETWSRLPPPAYRLPADRFTFQVIHTEADA